MTEITIYKTSKNSSNEILVKLLEKSLDEKQTSQIILQTESEIKKLDKFLWEFETNSFLPHAIFNEKNHSPIIINNEFIKESNNDILFLMANDLPEFYENLETKRTIIISHKANKEEEFLLSNFIEKNDLKITQIWDQEENGKWQKA